MHNSYFMWLRPSSSESGKELSLSAEASEWLFHAGYWQALSAEHSLNYEQYEEEVMPQTKIRLAVEKLTALEQDIRNSDVAAVKFTYGWDANKLPLECVATMDTLANETARLLEFLEQAEHSGFDVYCQL